MLSFLRSQEYIRKYHYEERSKPVLSIVEGRQFLSLSFRAPSRNLATDWNKPTRISHSCTPAISTINQLSFILTCPEQCRRNHLYSLPISHPCYLNFIIRYSLLDIRYSSLRLCRVRFFAPMNIALPFRPVGLS